MYARCQHGIDKRGGRLKSCFCGATPKILPIFCVIYYVTDPGGYFLLVFLRCEDETILPGFRGKVGGLLHRSRENAAFSAIIPEFCSVFRGVLQRQTLPKNKKKGLD